MAKYSFALKTLKPKEGGWTHHRHDPGGETYRGVARNYYPRWPGWSIIDTAKSDPHFPDNLKTNQKLQKMVDQFFRKYWKDGYNGIGNQTVASKVFTFGVVAGPSTAVKNLQRSLNYCGWRLKIDGRFGRQTLHAVNSTMPGQLLKEFRARCAVHFHKCVLRDPKKEVFFLGWMRRNQD
jgi:lysozyme family protein